MIGSDKLDKPNFSVQTEAEKALPLQQCSANIIDGIMRKADYPKDPILASMLIWHVTHDSAFCETLRGCIPGDWSCQCLHCGYGDLLIPLGPLDIHALETFLGYASPCLMDLFAQKPNSNV
jgi:hypothetical protein